MSQANDNTSTLQSDVDARIDSMPRVPLNFAGSFGLFILFFAANYEIGVFALISPSLLTTFGVDATALAAPVFWNLAGYGVGAYFFGHAGDRWGRRWGLMLTITVLALGNILAAFSWNIASFSFFRFIAGAGMGAVLALGSTYVGEMAPSNRRGLYLAKIYTAQAVFLLVVSFASLPVLDAMPETGWRFLIAFGGIAVLALAVLNRHGMMESPRWLVTVGQFEHAERNMQRLERNGWRGETPRILDEARPKTREQVDEQAERHSPIKTLMARPYLRRLAIILVFWFVYYLAAYGFLSYTPLILEALGIPAQSSLFLTVIGRASTVVPPLAMLYLIERIERRTLVFQGVAMMAIGLFLLFLPLGVWGGSIGVLLVNLGIGWSVTPGYIYTAEIFATRARGTASAIADGVGHMGGALAPFLVLPVLVSFGGVPTVLLIGGAAVLAGLVVCLGPKTRGRSISDI